MDTLDTTGSYRHNGGGAGRLLTAEDVAERLNIPKATIYEGKERIGGLVRIGRLVRWDPVRFEQWIAGGGQALPGGWRKEEAA